MPASVRSAHEVPADVERTFGALTGEQWPVALDERLSDGSQLVERTLTPLGGVRLVTRRRLPQGVPSFLARFVPADGAVTQVDEWGPEQGGLRAGTWTVDLAGAPGSIGGTTRVEPAAAGALWVVEGVVRVRVPLVGGRAESWLAPLVEQLVATQAEVLRRLVS